MTTQPESRRPPEGWWAEFTPLTFGRARIIVTDGAFVRDGWWYETPQAAARALVEWLTDPEAPEPEGWIRHVETGRRRPEGDASREYVMP